MLDAIRGLAKSWVAMILIGLLVISFAMWGIADIFTGVGTTTVAVVGDHDIGAREFQRAYNREIETTNRRLGTALTPQQALTLGVPTRVLATLTTEAVFAEKAGEMGLGISEQELARIIQTDPSLRGPTGTFDRNFLQQALSYQGMTENEYVLARRENALRAQIVDGLVGNMTVPGTYMEAFNAYQNEDRTIEYLELTEAQLPDLAPATEDELKTYFEENKSEFDAPEFRSFQLLVVDPESVANAASVSDDEARSEYEQVKTSKYGSPERRNFLQLPFDNAQLAKEAAEKIAGGATFEDVVTQAGKNVGDLAFGLKTKDEIIDPAIADAVFGLDENGVSDAIEGRFGNFLLKVTDIQPAAILPYEEVAERIKVDIAARNAESQVYQLYDDIVDARAGGAPLSEVAARFGLKVRDIVLVDRNGQTDAGQSVDLPEASQLLGEVFQSQIEEDTNPVRVGRQGFAWFNVTEIVDERERTFEEARSRVEESWRSDRQKTQLDDTANEIVQGLKSGRDLADLGAPLGLEVQTVSEITRGAPPETVSSSLVRAVFDGPDGHSGVADGTSSGSRVVFKVTQVSVPIYFEQAAGNEQAREQLQTALRETVLLQYVQEAQEKLGLQVNEQVLQYVVGLDTPPQHQYR